MDYLIILTGLSEADIEAHLKRHWRFYDANNDNDISFKEFEEGG